jgi:NarL family two-component system response regulator LiaR
MGELIKILVVDKDDSFRRATCEWLERADGMAVTDEAGNEQEAIESVHERQPDVVLLDVDTLHPGGLQTVVHIRELCPAAKIVMLSNSEQERLVLDAFRAGAQGHLVKGKSKPLEVVEAIRAVSRGESILSPSMAGWILDEMTSRAA